MAITRTAWHVLFAVLLRARAPGRVEVRSEVPLSAEPLRADYLLLSADGLTDDAPARMLEQLWEHITKDAIVELKSVAGTSTAIGLTSTCTTPIVSLG